MPAKIYIALPVLNEYENLNDFLKCLINQAYQNFELVVCVNQPDIWWDDLDKLDQCENNQKSIDLLTLVKKLDVKIIDKSSKGSAWNNKKYGVGWARKLCMDYCAKQASENDIILCVDADISFKEGYLSSIVSTIDRYPKAVVLSVPYYHPLSGDEENDRNILRYEIYMRYYALNLWRVQNRYNFTALGSAIAVPVWAYKRINGMTPHKSGEDFYFLQKLRKFGEVITWNPEKVYPSARYSDRVFFGTGPALIKGRGGDWSSYPIYNYRLFDEVEKSYATFQKLFEEEVEFPMKSFLDSQFGAKLWYVPLRKNSKTLKQFVKLITDKVDALRILQYLKSEQKKRNDDNESNLVEFLRLFYTEDSKNLNLANLSFDKSTIEDLNELRNFLQAQEEKYQQNDWK